jgi:elongation factor 1-gamma
MSHKIFSYPNNQRVWKAQIAGNFTGLQIEVPDFQIGVDNKTPEFAAKFPLQKVPALETPEGPLFESNAIARYAARYGGNSKIYGSSAYESSLIDQWIDFSANEIELPASAWLYPIFEIVPFNAEATERAKTDIKKALELLNKHLTYRTYLVGERISLADIVVSMALYRLYTMVMDITFRKNYGNVNRWFLTCVNQPQFRTVLGEVKLAEKMAVAKGATAAPAKKAETTTAAKKAETTADAGGDEEEGAAKPKAKSKLDLLPPTKLDLDEWKRTYSNNKILEVAMPWFWEHFDAEGWSLWQSEYKYNDELTKMFMTSNLVGGFLQRMDKIRKYGFGSLLIFGEEPKLQIGGVWLFRGTELPEELWENPDAEHHTWTKIDHNDAAQRKTVETYWSWEGDFGDRKFHDNGKIFK